MRKYYDTGNILVGNSIDIYNGKNIISKTSAAMAY